MIKHWLKPALQTTYQDARYASARTRYGLTATRAHPRGADKTRPRAHATTPKGLGAVTMPSPAEAGRASGHRRRTATRHANGPAPGKNASMGDTIDQSLYLLVGDLFDG